MSAVIRKGAYYLFGRKRKNTGPYPNTWLIIGGGVNLEKETLEQALVREIREETGISVRHIIPLGFDEDYEPDKHGEMTHYVFLQYRVDYASGKAKAGDDIHELIWLRKKEFVKKNFSRPTTKLFEALGLMR